MARLKETLMFLVMGMVLQQADCACPNLTNPVGGNVLIQNSRASYTCQVGLYVNGDNYRDCIGDVWTGSKPTCETVVCPDPGILDNGNIVIGRNGLEYNEVITYECNTGYRLIGTSTRTCEWDGFWTGTAPPTCEILSCSTPTNPVNGEVTFTGTVYGSTATYTCNLGYVVTGTLITSTTIACTENGWGSTAVTCSIDTEYCPFLSEFPSISRVVNAVVTLSCTQDGYYLEGDSTLTCETDGSWSSQIIPTCRIKDCGGLSAVSDGYFNLTSGTTYGSVASYYCNEGFILSLSSRGTPNIYQRTCLMDGWSGLDIQCNRYQCNQRTNPTDGSVSLSDQNFYGSRAEYVCDSGYELIGQSSYDCTINGWMPSNSVPYCQIYNCGSLVSPNNGEVDTSGGTLYGDVATYRCFTGYTASTSTQSQCLSNGQWSITSFTCIPVVCPSLPSISNGKIDVTSNSYGQVARFSCNIGFVGTGISSTTCQADGQWTSYDFRCDVYECSRLSPPNNGYLSLDQDLVYNYGSVAGYTCQDGYRLVGINFKNCTMSDWQPTEIPTCQIRDCGSLVSPNNGEVDTSGGTLYGDVATYRCFTGYTASTSTQSQCLSNGQWSITSFTCIPVVCPSLPSISNGKIDVTSNSYGQVARFSCNIGFVGTGISSTTCQADGQWTSYDFRCDVYECSRLSPPNNGYLSLDQDLAYNYGSVAGYTCQDGYRLVGINYKNCTMSDWQPTEIPTCQIRDCGSLVSPNNGNVDTSGGTFYGAVATYRCYTGYTASTSTQSQCLSNGQWSITSFTCNIVVCTTTPLYPAFGTIDISSSNYGGTAQYRCTTDGYVASGSSIATCQANGQWSTVDFQCNRHECTPELTAPNNGRVEYTDLLYYASQATYVCNDGYQVIGINTRNCTLSGWGPSQQTTYCQIYDCGVPTRPNYGSVSYNGGTQYNAVARYTCDTGYTTTDPLERYCSNGGQWSGTLPTCFPVTCPSLPSISNGKIDVTSNSYGQVARFSCNIGFVGTGISSTTCQANGQWTSYDFRCDVYECSRLSPPNNGYLSLDQDLVYNYGSVAGYTCQDGYRLVGINYKNCTMSDWQPTEIPTCQIRDCGSLVSPNNGEVDTSGGTFYGDIATYRCFTGYTASTSTQSQCLSNGQWSITSFACNIVVCATTPLYPAFGTIDISSSSYGGTAQYRCMTDGYVASGSSIATCQANGQWSTVDFQCNRHECTPELTAPNNGRVEYTDLLYYASQATYVCNDGYRVIGINTRNCTLSGWEPSQQTTYCQIYDCGVPTRPNYGSVSYNGGTQYNAVARYTCDTGYTTTDPLERYCSNGGQWSGTLPTCFPVNCLDPPNLPFGTLIYSGGTTYGQTVRYECLDGYVFTGTDYTICQSNGLWSSASRSCDRYECLPYRTAPNNGYMTQSDSNYFGSKTEYSCVDGYQLVGSSSSSQNCTMDGWVPSQAPVCQIRDCGIPPSITDGTVSYPQGTQYNDIATYICLSGYVGVAGSVEIQCNRFGSWSGSPLQCVPVDCGQPAFLANGNIVRIGSTTYRSTVTYECNEGYTLDGSNTTTCQASGLWSTEGRACNLYDCGLRYSPNNGNVDLSDGTLYGSIATYTCSYGYERIGTASQRCTSYGWDPNQTPYCQIYDCGQPPMPLNGYVLPGGTQYGSIATYGCDTGYFIIAGNTERTCDHLGFWTGVAVECSIVQCGTPPFPLNGYATRTDITSFRGTVGYECNEGYLLEGSSYSTCQADGSWSPEAPTCRRRACANLNDLTNGEILRSDQNFYSSIATYRCFTGYQLVGTSTRNCTLNDWVPEQASYCQVADCGSPPTAENVQVVYTGDTTYGAVVEYSCSTGYTGILANTRIICGSSGQWSSVDLQCRPVDCGTPVIPNTSLYRYLEYNVQGTTYGSIARFSCEIGYQLDGQEQLTCTATGQWSDNIPMCRVVDCGGLPVTIEHGEVTGTGTSYGQSRTFTCYLGYQLAVGVTSRTITCGVDGFWDGVISNCFPVDCGNLTAPENGQIDVPSTTYLEIAAYTCNIGHDLMGSNHRQCQADSTWNRATPLCIPYNCGELSAPAFGDVNTPDGTTYGKMAVYTCDLGYHATAGNLIRTCFNGSRWDGAPPVCTLHDCGPVPTQMDNGQVSSTGTTYGSTATFSCHSNYNMLDGATQVTLTCDEDGHWSGDWPTCHRTDCGPLIAPWHGNLTIENQSTTKVVRYMCNLGYQLIGNEQRVCQTDGTWSGEEPVCNLTVCENVTSPDHGVVRLLNGSLDGSLLGHIASYSCQTGYRLLGNVNRTCLANGQWSGTPPTCQLHDCGSLPEVIANGEVVSSGTRYQDTFIYACDRDYHIYKNGQVLSTHTITCMEDGQWSDTPPTCSFIDCGPVSAPDHGYVIQSPSNRYGSLVVFQCDDGYRLIGNEITYCQANGNWNATTPLCEILDCGSLVSPLFGEVLVDGTTYGEVATYRCNMGYSMVIGSVIRMCGPTGQWNGTQIVCELTDCGGLEEPAHGTVFVPSGTRFGSLALYSCDTGYYESGGSTVRTCTDVGWDGLPIECTIYNCMMPPSIRNGNVAYPDGTTYGAVATYTCNLGYYISAGLDKIYCGLNGNWNGTTPTCTPYECATLSSPDHGLVTVTLTFYGERADYICDEGYYLSDGDQTRICPNNSNTWNGTQPTCLIHTCGLINMDIDNGDASSTGSQYQDTVVYTCYRGYLIEGMGSRTHTVTCTGNGRWSDEQTPVCTTVDCGQPEDLLHGRLSVSGTGFGAMAQYYCDVGYRMNGTSSVLCQEDGAWSSRVPDCLVYDCGMLPEIEAGSVIMETSTFGGTAYYMCDMGYFISSGFETRVCQDGGIWSGAQPICSKYDCGPLSTSLLHGDAIQTGTKYGDTTVYSCDAGYHIEGFTDSTLTVDCTATGDWSRPKPTCVLVDCGQLTSPNHGGYRLESGTIFLDVAYYYCDVGYQLEGRSTVICLDNGEWSGERPECNIHDCGPLESPEHGFVQLLDNNNLYGSTARYVCQSGYYISSGNEERRCTDDGTWDGIQPTCSDIDNLACGIRDQDVGILILTSPTQTTTNFRYLKNALIGFVDKMDIDSGRTKLGIMDYGPFTISPESFSTRREFKQFIDDTTFGLSGMPRQSLAAQLLMINALYRSDGHKRPDVPLHLMVIMDSETPVDTDAIEVAERIREDNTIITIISIDVTNTETLQEVASVHFHSLSSFMDLQMLPGNIYELPHCNCGRPPILDNGSEEVNDGTYFLDEAVYSCNQGFMLQSTTEGSTTLECGFSGEWTGAPPICVYQDCGFLRTPEHGLVLKTGQMLGSMANYSCNTGYRLEGASYRICDSTGAWNPTPESMPTECILVDCGPLPRPPNGNMASTGTAYGDVARFMCNTGYYLEGARDLQCTETGDWSDQLPYCERYKCGLPNANVIVMVEVPSSMNEAEFNQIKTVVTYLAKKSPIDSGQTNFGFFFFTDSVKFSKPLGELSTFNEVVNVIDSMDFFPSFVPSNVSRGLEAMYSMFTTRPLSNQSDKENIAILIANTLTQFDFMVMGRAAELDIDIKVATSLQTELPLASFWIYNSYSDLLQIVKTNYEQTFCNCGIPPSLENGQMDISEGTYYLDIIHYSCYDGYRLEGPQSSTCQDDGLWDQEMPTCVRIADCGPVEVPDHGSGDWTGTSIGSIVVFQCDQGYQLVGTGLIVCLPDGQWSDPEPVCTRNATGCPPLSDPQDGIVTISTDLSFGSVVTYTCHTGYYLTGDETRTCRLNGQWDGQAPTCTVHDCGAIEKPANANMQLSGTTYGKVASFSCSIGYELVGADTLTCTKDGSWSASIPACQITECPAITDLDNGYIQYSAGFRVGSTASFSCDTGYQLNGPQLIICNTAGRWSNTIPTCEAKDCGPVPTIPDGRMLIEGGTTYGAEVEFTCNMGYSLVGSTTITCEADGRWSANFPTCMVTDCGDLFNPDHGSVSAAVTTFGQVAQYTCNEGYIMSGASTRICQISGEWSGLAPDCTAKDCGFHDGPQNGFASFPEGTGFGKSAVYSCSSGFGLSGLSKRVCGSTGQWMGDMPTCRSQDCGSAPTIQNGFVISASPSTTVGSVVVYGCNSGYSLQGLEDLEGSGLVTCQTNGQWSTAPICTLTDCGVLTNPVDGSVFISRDSDGQQTALYRCDPGYILSGNEIRTCGDQGMWTGSKPSCVRTDCGTLNDPRNGEVTYTGSTVGSSAFYSCDSGYEMDGMANRLCQSSGGWSGDAPTCILRACPAMPDPLNGRVELSAGSNYGSVAMFYCDSLYEVMGSSSLVCLADGNWSGSPPSCLIGGTIEAIPVNMELNLTLPSDVDFQNQTTRQLYSEEIRSSLLDTFRSHMGGSVADIVIVDIQRGSLIVDFTMMMRESGPARRELSEVLHDIAQHTQPIWLFNTDTYPSRMQVKTTFVPIGQSAPNLPEMLCIVRLMMEGNCDLGYICMVINSEAICQPDPSTDCGTPLSPTNGGVGTPEGTRYGATVIYSCNTGFTMEGQSQGTCGVNGRWEPSRPMCRVTDCGNLMDPLNGDVVVIGTQYLNTARYSCNTGYSLIGTALVNCQADGHWSASPPTCTFILCGNLNHPSNGNVVISPDGQSGIYTCNDGYKLVGSRLRTCLQSAQWEGSAPSCQIVTCDALTNPANGLVDVSSGLSYGHTATYSCVGVEFELMGPSVRTCTQDGSWSGTAPTCQLRDCGLLAMIRNGQMDTTGTKYGDQATFQCNTGYILHGVPKLICLETGWDNPQPTCLHVGDCGGLTNPTNGVVKVDNGTGIGARVSYECYTGYRLVGDTSRLCLSDSTWSGAQPYCSIQECPVLMNPEGGQLQLSGGLVYGQTASIICDTGYKVEGPSSITCQADGTWSGALGCTNKNCGTLPNPDHGVVDLVMGTNYGAQAQYQCNPGYILTGTSMRTCGTTEQWSLTPPTCQVKDCGPLMDPVMGTVTLNSNSTYGSIATYRCDLGYRLVGTDQRQCGADGMWTHTQPDCIIMECGVLADPVNGRVTVTMGSFYGSVASYSCDQGYRLTGQHVNRTCMGSQQWSGVPPTCSKVNCGSIRDPLFGRVSLSSGTTFNSRATYTCSTGYILDSSELKERICMHNGSWSGSMPSCVVVDCGNPPRPSNGKVSAPEGSVYGRVATYTCDNNYDLDGPKTRTCQADGYWSETAPDCEMGNNFKLALGLGIGLSGFFILILVIILAAVICYRRNNYRDRIDRKYGSRSRMVDYTTPVPTISYGAPVRMRQQKPVLMPVGPQMVVDDAVSVYTDNKSRYKLHSYDNLPRDEYINYSYYRPNL